MQYSVVEELAGISLMPLARPLNKSEKSERQGAGSQEDRSFFGSYSFAETVGLWLESGRKPAAALLSPFISTEGFSFTPAEYIDLRGRVNLAIRRYERLPNVSRGLEDLNTGFFRHQSLEESREFITSHLTEYLLVGEALHREFLVAINRHARATAVSRRTELRAATEELGTLKDRLEEARRLSGRNRRKKFNQLAKEWQHYQARYTGEKNAAGIDEEDELSEAIAAHDVALVETRKNLPRELQSGGLALSALTVNPRHGDADTLASLADRLKELVRMIDEAGLYQLPLRGTETATTPRQLQQLEGLLERLRNTRHHLAELPLFYERRHFWYAQPAHLRRLLAPLRDLPITEWEPAFTSWYFERCLEREENPQRWHTETEELSKRFVSWEKNYLAGEYEGMKSVDRLNILGETDPWPSTVQPDDLLLSLTGKDDLPTGLSGHKTRIAPLQDTTANHIAVAGRREPTLLFSQVFLPHTFPQWRVRKVETAPVSALQDRLLLQPDGGEWQPLKDWKVGRSTKLSCYFPAELIPEDAGALLDCWEQIIADVPEIVFFHEWSPDAITQALLSDGFSAEFLCAALLRAAEAASFEPFDREALVALGREVRLRCGLPTPAPHPLAEEIGNLLQDRLPDYFFEVHLPWRDTFLPLVVTSPSGKKQVLLPNGRLPGLADNLSEARRQAELTKAGFGLIDLPAANIWENTDEALEKISLLLNGGEGSAL